MKKIVALGAAAALVGGLFAAEPASNPSVVSFTGNASVEWGVDLDAGKTGFKNDTWTELKLKLFDAGDKSTSGDGVWAELVLKVDDDSSVGPNGYKDGEWLGYKNPEIDTTSAEHKIKDGTGKWNGKKAYIDVAKLHFNNIYIGIKAGDTQTGELDFTTAIRSADPWFHPGRWLKNVGPDKFTQGIVAGYEDDNFNFGVDFRSYEDGQYTDAYALAAEFKLKDSNSLVEGLSAGVGASYNLNDFHFSNSEAGTAAKINEGYEIKGKYDIDGDGVIDDTDVLTYDHLLGYSASVGYKLKIDDTYWLKPQVGLTGVLATSKNTEKTDVLGVELTTTTNISLNANIIAAGLMFGWGDTNSYGSTGLYYLDVDDRDDGETPGISAIAYIPLPTVMNTKEEVSGAGASKTYTDKSTYHGALKALIVPSVFSGDLVPNLKFGAYSEIGLFDYRENQPDPVTGDDSSSEFYAQTEDYKNTFALALTAGLKYDIKVDEITVTPKASARYANTCYVANKDSIKAAVPGAGDKDLFVKDEFGIQSAATEGERAGFLSGDFFNLEAGVDVAGLINNTTFYAHYKSANLLNNTDYSAADYGTYNVKLGTFNVGCKIAF
jgi:hypothetical protein